VYSTISNTISTISFSKRVKLSLLATAIASSLSSTAWGAPQQPAPDLFGEPEEPPALAAQSSSASAKTEILSAKVNKAKAKAKALAAKAVKGRNRAVSVHTDALDADTLTLNLFDDVVVTAVRDRMIDKIKGSTTWIGHVEGEPDSEVFLTVRGRTVSGNVQIDNKTYEIEPKENNQHDITQVDPTQNPKHSHSKRPEDFLAAGGQIDTTPAAFEEPATSAATAGTVIDLLVAYTPKAKTNAGGQAGIEAKITNAVAMANQAYLNSNIDMQLNLVGMKETAYTETGNISTSLTDLTGTSDGKMDEIHTLRNQLGADQVALITADTNACGIAYVMTSSWVKTAFAPYAFSVVHDDSKYACLSSQSLAHELGHNQGDQHNIEDSGGTAGAYSYSYGHRVCQTGGFRTVMSYSCSGGTRVSYFSNPNVTLTTGQLTGTSTANNALSMTNTKAIVAAFRSSTSTTAPTLPAAPASLAAAVRSSSQIALTWADKSSNETGFRIERSGNGGINWSEIAVVGSNVASFTDNGLLASTTYQYRVRAYNSSGNSAYSNIGTATTRATVSDTTPPTVSILNPAAGARVNGTVGINVKASDNVGVSSLKLYIDGKLVGSGNTSSLSYSWNTRSIRNGTHTISSQATDAAGNSASRSISVTKR
jgi:hypothetical protein